MNVRFIDTSILLNLLKVPSRCDKAQEVSDDFKQAVKDERRFVIHS